MKKIISIILLMLLLISALASAEPVKSKAKKVLVKLPPVDSQKVDVFRKEMISKKADAPQEETVSARCMREGTYTYTSAVPCCEGLARQSDGRCVPANVQCSREGMYTFGSGAPCCEGLELDARNRCKRPAARKTLVKLPESTSQGCPADLRRMQEKLNQILRIVQTN